MKLLGLRKPLYDELDAMSPDWRDKVDNDKIMEARFSGDFDEIGLLKHLRDKFRAEIYRKVYTKGAEISEKIKEEGSASILPAFREFGGFAYSEIEALLRIEREIANLITEYEDSKEFGASGDVNVDLARISRRELEHLKESSAFGEQESIRFFIEVNNLLGDFDSSRESEWRDLKTTHLALFKAENDRSVEVQKKILHEDFFGILKARLESSNGPNGRTTRDISLTKQEKELLLGKMKGATTLEVRNQQKLRADFVIAVSQATVGKSTLEEIVAYIRSFDVLTEQQKLILQEIIYAGFIGFENIRNTYINLSQFGDSPNPGKAVLKCVKKISFAGIYQAIDEAEVDHKIRINSVYESQVYKICNGGGWAVISHVASLGFCTSYTLTAAIIDLIKGYLSGLSGLRLIVKIIEVILDLPLKFIPPFSFKKLFKDAFEDFLCETVKDEMVKFINNLARAQ